MKLTVLCDLDSILADILASWLRHYNDKWSDSLTVEQIKGWDFHRYVKPECGTKIYEILHTPNFFLDLRPLPGALEAVDAIRSDGHDFLVLTAGADVEDAATQKIRWCKKYLGLSEKQVMITPRKALVKGDVLIDDSPEQIRKYREAWPSAPILSICYPYNAEVDDLCCRFVGWRDPAGAWKMITGAIGALERAR